MRISTSKKFPPIFLVITTIVITGSLIQAAEEEIGNTLDLDETIIWNGCESQAAIETSSFITVDKPQICTSRIPDYLQRVTPQATKSPFKLKVVKTGNSEMKLIIFMAPNKHSTRSKVEKNAGFQSVLISSQTPEGVDVGEFEISDEGRNDRFDIGYCCGTSRRITNFYFFRSISGESSILVNWKVSNKYKGTVYFNATVLQNERTYWNLPTEIITV